MNELNKTIITEMPYILLLATKEDLYQTRTELKAEIQEVKLELKAEINKLSDKIENIRTELKTDAQDIKTELKTEIKDIKNLFWAIIVGIIIEISKDWWIKFLH